MDIPSWLQAFGQLSPFTWLFGITFMLAGAGIIAASIHLGHRIKDPTRNYGGEGLVAGVLTFLFGLAIPLSGYLDAIGAKTYPYLVVWGIWLLLVVTGGGLALRSAIKRSRSGW